MHVQKSTLRWLPAALWLAVFLWAAAIFYLSSLTGREIDRVGIHLWDKASHFIAFAAGGTALALALCVNTSWPPGKVTLIAALAIAAYGATDEWHQLYTAYRSGGDVLDWFADALGGTIGAALTTFIHARRTSTNRPPAAGN